MSASLATWLYIAAGSVVALCWLRHVRAIGLVLVTVAVGALWPLFAVAVALHMLVEIAKDRVR